MQKGVFLPRFETEQLTELVIDYSYALFASRARILEIGTGSGVIAISLALAHPHWQITASDISVNSLKLSQKNCDLHNVDINLVKSDLFAQITGKYDVIVTNLPYVADNTILTSSVLSWDPKLALFAGPQGLNLFHRFLAKVSHYLNKRFLIVLEFGYDQKEHLNDLIQYYLPNSNFIFKKDFAGHDRFVFIYCLA